MTNFFRKRKLRVFSVAVFFVIFSFLFISNTDKVVAAVLQGDSSSGYYYTDLSGAKIKLNTYRTTVRGISGIPIYVAMNGSSFMTDQDGNLVPLTRDQAIDYGLAGAQGQEMVGCNFWLNFITGNFWEATGCFLARVFYTVLALVSLLLGLVGILFNFVFKFTVVDIKQNTENIAAIAIGWRAVRDIANISFIFILLYLAIATILQLGEHGVKKSLSTLIIAAVLINFSLFFVKIIIDVPNILAIQIYNKAMSGVTSNTEGKTSGGLGDAFLTMFAPQAVFQDSSQNSATNLKNIGQASANASNWNLAKNPLSTFAMGIIIMTVAIAVFLAVCVILIKRFVMLIFYMIFSPLAFAGMAIPIHSLQGTAREKFWNGLIKEAFYAPIFMLCVYITLSVGYALNTNAAKFDIADITGAFQGVVGNIVSYSVVMVMLVASLFIAEMMGVKGAAGAMSVYNGVTGGARGMAGGVSGWLGANTLGRIGSTLGNKGEFAMRSRDMAAGRVGNNMFSRFAYKQIGRARVAATTKAAGAKFGGNTSYDERQKKREEEFKAANAEHHDSFATQADTLIQGANDNLGAMGTDFKAADALHHGFSTEDHANIQLELQNRLANMAVGDPNRARVENALRRYYTDHGHGRLTPNQAVEVEKMQQERLLAFHKENMRRNMFQHDADHNMIINPATGRPIANATSLGVGGAARTMFDGLSDRQQADLITSLRDNEQVELANNPEFQAALAENFRTFDMIERAGKGASVSQDMKNQLSNIAYGALRRNAAARALRDAMNNAAIRGTPTYDRIRDEYERAHGIVIGGRNDADIINDYESGEQGRNDATFRTPNLTRFLPSNQAYMDMVQRYRAMGVTV